MSKLNQIKIPVELLPQYKWRLTREDDNQTFDSAGYGFIEWKDGAAVAIHPEIEVDRSCILDYHGGTFTWQTTEVTEIIENGPELMKFKTKNSTYVLEKI